MRVVIIGRGRAGGAFAGALEAVGCEVDIVEGSHLSSFGSVSTTVEIADVDLVLLCVPDDAIRQVASNLSAPGAVVAHCSGSRTLDELGSQERVASIHPLMSLPDADIGVERLLDQCTFAVAGDPIGAEVVGLLRGTAIEVADDARPIYHAAACVAANHLVVLAAQVERLAATVGVPVEAYWTMMRTTLENVEAVGAAAALTGPASRGDLATIGAHLDALEPDEHDLYRTLADHAARLARP